MRVVAIAALDDPFVHPVLEGHGELTAYVRVAAVAEFRLPFREEQFGSGRFVDRVAVGANNICLCVRGPANLGPCDVFRVAFQASFQSFLLRHDGERTNGCLTTFRVDVRLAWAVAAFAPGQLGRLLSDRYALKMGVARKREPYVRVASLTDIAADVAVRSVCLRRVCERNCAQEGDATN